MNLAKELSDKFQKALQLAFPELEEREIAKAIEIVQSTQAKFGDYQCNTPMKLAKPLKRNPRQIAELLIRNLEPEPQISNLEIAGPGFINITISPDYVSLSIEKIFDHPHLNVSLPKKKERVIVEFSSPNTAKELHVGHLRSTIIGDSLARVFEFLGYDVIRLNHIGDWGTAFGMLIAFLKEEAPDVLSGNKTTDLSHLVEWYKASKNRFDKDLNFKKISQLEVVALQRGDPHSIHAWKIICDISRKAYQEIYDLLEIKIQERGESFYNPIIPEMIADLENRGLILLSNGAKCFFLEEFKNREGAPLPLMLQKSDGGYGYDTTDMAAMKQRVQDEKVDRIIILTDAGQSQHFQMIHAAAKKAGYINPEKVRFDHVPFGLVLGSDGKKFRTRCGETEKLIDLIKTAIDRAKEMMQERNPELSAVEQNNIAEKIGIGAIKYADLSSHRTSDYIFSYDKMLRFEGNTAAFLMYVYVRIEGIKRKIQRDHLKLIRSKHTIQLEHPSEIALGIHLIQFNEALQQVVEDLLPNRLTDYLYGLANKFNAFYRDCQVEGTPKEASRLLLCEVVARTMKQGLYLLGVDTVERM
jgi:arginyl-tRNA synthetase